MTPAAIILLKEQGKEFEICPSCKGIGKTPYYYTDTYRKPQGYFICETCRGDGVVMKDE